MAWVDLGFLNKMMSFAGPKKAATRLKGMLASTIS
jgi:hypothetical protein